ncbi:MAG: hypothetical protein ACLRL6_13155 [Clostridium sp.]
MAVPFCNILMAVSACLYDTVAIYSFKNTMNPIADRKLKSGFAQKKRG